MQRHSTADGRQPALRTRHPSFVTRLSAFCIASLAALAASADIYLNAAATGAADGTSWENAFTTVPDAIAALNAAPAGGRVLRIAKGIYVISAQQTISVDGFEVLGGYRASADGDDVRDTEEYQTIISGAANPQNANWTRLTPKPGEYKFTTAATTYKLIVDGKVNYPDDFNGDFDFFYSGSGGNFKQLVVAKDISGRISGVNFTCGFRQPNLTVSSGTGEVEVTDCIFFANYPQGLCLAFGSVTRGLLGNCRLLGNDIPYGSGVLSLGGNTCVSNCLFQGNRNNSYYGGCVASVGGAGCSFKKTTFTRNVGTFGLNGIGNISALVTITAACTFEDCAFTNNYAAHNAADASVPFPLVQLRGGTAAFVRCVFAGNWIDFQGNDGNAYAIVGGRGTAGATSYDGCLFAGNTLHAKADGNYAAGIVGGLYDGDKIAVVNSVFDSNVAEIDGVAAAEATAALSRGPVLYTAAASGCASQLSVANCTFLGPQPEGVAEIAQAGNGHAQPLTVANCLFLTAGDAPAVPFAFDVPALATVVDCTVKNLDETFRPTDYDLTDGLRTDDVPLTDDYVPLANLPGLRETADLAFSNPDAVPRTFQLRPRGAAAWQPLLSSRGTAVDPPPSAVGDLVSATARPFGAQTRGAVQTLTPDAENGATLTIRRSPLTAGTVSTPSTQAVATGAPIIPVTATPTGDNSFAGWYEGGNLVSSSPTLEIAALSADRVITATFSTRAVTIVFDLQGKGTFNANGASTLSVAAHAGEAFPALPPFTLADGYVFIGTDAFPALVPDTADDFLAVPEIITKDVRVVYATPEGAGLKDGTSWANAYGDLGAAMADAGKWRGEVWLKTGRYVSASAVTQLPLLSNVALRGGFTGNESDASAADPAAHPTVLCGDLNGDDCWQSISNNVIATQGVIWDYDALTYSFPNPQGVDDAWRPTANVSDNAKYCFFSEVACSNVAFHGITFTGFKNSAVYNVSNISGLLVSNCLFVANGGALATISNNNYYHALQSGFGGESALVDTRFVGNAYCANLSNPVLAGPATNLVLRCDLVGNYGYGIALSTATSSVIRVEQCNVVSNGVGSWVSLSTTFSAGRLYLEDSIFRTNRLRNGGNMVVAGSNPNAQYAPATRINRCRFEDNVLNTTGGGCLGVVLTGGGYHSVLVRACAWRGNVINTTGADANSVAVIAAAQTAYSQAYYYDCTFADNVVTGSFSVATSRAGVISRAQVWGATYLLNCAFVGNAFHGLPAANVGEVVTAANANTANRHYSFANCVFDTTIDGHRPFCLGTACALYLHNCAAAGYGADNTGITTGTLVVDKVSAESPAFTPAWRVDASGLPARGLSARSPFARCAYEPAMSSAGWIYYYNPDNYDKTTLKPWVSIGPGTTYTAAQGEAAGLSLDNLLPDALGNTRRCGKVALGPLNAPAASTRVLVR